MLFNLLCFDRTPCTEPRLVYALRRRGHNAPRYEAEYRHTETSELEISFLERRIVAKETYFFSLLLLINSMIIAASKHYC